MISVVPCAVEEEMVNGFLCIFITVRADRSCCTVDAEEVFVKGYMACLKLHKDRGMV